MNLWISTLSPTCQETGIDLVQLVSSLIKSLRVWLNAVGGEDYDLECFISYVNLLGRFAYLIYGFTDGTDSVNCECIVMA